MPPSMASLAMSTEGEPARYRALVDDLLEHDRRYYVEMAPTITVSLRTLRSVPPVLAEPVDVTVRGEAFFEKQDFAAMNAEREAAGEDTWKNPRNAAGGSLKMLDAREVARRPLRVLFYELVN